MKRILLALALFTIIGCGPKEETPQEKKERIYKEKQVTISRLNVIADTWDGTEKTPEFTPTTDAWGGPIQAQVKKGSLNYTLEVWSNGIDGLPKNYDDIVVTRAKRHGENSINKEAEKFSNSVSKGITKGIREGWREGGEEAPKKDK